MATNTETISGATNVDWVQFAVHVLDEGAGELRAMCAEDSADDKRINVAIMPMEAARRGGIVIDGAIRTLWGIWKSENDADFAELDKLCDPVEVYESAWRDFARAFNFPDRLSKRLDYVLNSMCDPCGGAMAGTLYQKEWSDNAFYKDFTPENYADNVRIFRHELQIFLNPCSNSERQVEKRGGGAAKLARTEAATVAQGAKIGEGVPAAGSDAANVAERQGAATGPRMPRGDEAKFLQMVYILHNARKDGRTNWDVARSVLDCPTLTDPNGVPVRMFNDSGEAFGYKLHSMNAFKTWVRRAADDDDAAQMAREFEEHGRAPDL